MEANAHEQYLKMSKQSLIESIVEKDKEISQCKQQEKCLIEELEHFKIQFEELIAQNQRSVKTLEKISQIGIRIVQQFDQIQSNDVLHTNNSITPSKSISSFTSSENSVYTSIQFRESNRGSDNQFLKSDFNYLEMMGTQTIKILQCISSLTHNLIAKTKKRSTNKNYQILRKSNKMKFMDVQIEAKESEIAQLNKQLLEQRVKNKMLKGVIKSLEKEKKQVIGNCNQQFGETMALLEQSALISQNKEQLIGLVNKLGLMIAELHKQRKQQVFQLRASYRQSQQKYQQILRKLKKYKKEG